MKSTQNRHWWQVLLELTTDETVWHSQLYLNEFYMNATFIHHILDEAKYTKHLWGDIHLSLHFINCLVQLIRQLKYPEVKVPGHDWLLTGLVNWLQCSSSSQFTAEPSDLQYTWHIMPKALSGRRWTNISGVGSHLVRKLWRGEPHKYFLKRWASDVMLTTSPHREWYGTSRLLSLHTS